MVKALAERIAPVCRGFWKLVVFCALAGPSVAQDVQTGHYAPGWNVGLRAGTMPEKPGWYFLNTTMYFNASRFKDGAGNTSSDAETDYLLTALAISWRPDYQLLGGDYMAVATPAFGNLSGLPILVDGQPQDPGSGLTDLYFAPLVLGWHFDDLDLVAALGGFAPTGKFELGSSKNTGLGFWTFIPHVAASYRADQGIFEKTPLLAMGAARYEIHSNQQGRDFRPGNTFTFEWSLGLEVGRATELGVSGFLYRQVTDPSGADARPVDKYRSNGIGVHVAHNFGVLSLGLRVYRDFDVRNGPEGTLGYLELGFGWPRSSKN
jgi:hypothetical protein